MQSAASVSPQISPFAREGWDHEQDSALCQQAGAGSKTALNDLLRRHQRWFYNVALRLVLSPAEAEELAQEAMMRVVTRLSSFEGRSTFRTWAYRILYNCFVDETRKRKLESAITGFAAYGRELDALPARPLPAGPLPVELPTLVQEAQVGCMLGMLLCLTRAQRMAYVLADIFEASSATAAEILGITPEAYRQRLKRARRDLISFMNDKCGLVAPSNPCRCEKKTAAFIENGWVDAESLKYTRAHLEDARKGAPALAQAWSAAERRAALLFQQHPVLKGPDIAEHVAAVFPQLALSGAPEPE